MLDRDKGTAQAVFGTRRWHVCWDTHKAAWGRSIAVVAVCSSMSTAIAYMRDGCCSPANQVVWWCQHTILSVVAVSLELVLPGVCFAASLRSRNSMACSSTTCGDQTHWWVQSGRRPLHRLVCGVLPLWGGRCVGRLTCVAMNTAQHVASHAGSIMLVCTCNPRRRCAKRIREQIVGDWLPTPAHSQRSTWSWGCHSHNCTLPFSIDGVIAYDQHWSCGHVVPSLQIL